MHESQPPSNALRGVPECEFLNEETFYSTVELAARFYRGASSRQECTIFEYR